MKHNTQSFTHAFLALCFVSSLLLAGSINVSAQVPGVIIIIGSDTTWTKADSPHTLTGPLLVNQGATLTIEAGATVNLNDYEFRVNGTLRAIGSSADQIVFENGTVTFTKYGSAWDEQKGSGCLIENAVIKNTLCINGSLKLSNSEVSTIVVDGGGSPTIVNNLVSSIRVNDGVPKIFDNEISYYVALGGNECSPVISGNFIKYGIRDGAEVAGGSPVITNNVISEGDVSVGGVSAVITGNTINGTLEFRGHGGSALISNNTITPPSRIIDSGVWIVPNYTAYYSGIILEGTNEELTISNNTIKGGLIGIEVGPKGAVLIEKNLICYNNEAGIKDYWFSSDLTIVDNTFENNKYGIDNLKAGTIQRNFITSNSVGIKCVGSEATIQNNTLAKNGVAIKLSDSPVATIEDNFIHDNNVGIELGLNTTIRNNTITSNRKGILGTSGESVTIERNYLQGNDCGIQVSFQADIRNNTIVDSYVSIMLQNCPSATIRYNNIENYTDKSVYLEGTSSNFDATNNWWGTNDPEAINYTIHDYKYAFELGKVTFVPLLSEPNTKATSDTIPEFPAWLVLPLFLMTTFVVVAIRKKIWGVLKMMRLVSRVFLMFILISSLALAGGVQVFAEAPGIIVIIGSDTTWTKADSPHMLTGPVLVDQGVTLVIEAGSTVDLGGYEIRVNGTLRAVGTSASLIHFKKGIINFTEFSDAWNEQTGSGSVIQYAVLEDVEVFNSVPVNINENPLGDNNVWTKEMSPINFTGSVIVDVTEILTIEAGVTVNMQSHDLIVKGTLRVFGNQDIVYFSDGKILFTDECIGWNEQTGVGSIVDCAVLDGVEVVCNASVKIFNSKITNPFSVSGSPIVTGNVIQSLYIDGGSGVISNNKIHEILACHGSPEISNNTIDSISGSGGSPLISGNTITKIGYVEHVSDTYKTIHHFSADLPIITNNFVTDGIYLETTGHPTVSYNTIAGHTYEYKYMVYAFIYPLGTQTATAITSGIVLEDGGDVIGNTIYDCVVGIKGGTTIEGNVLINNQYGVQVYHGAEIQGNTFRDNDCAVFTTSDTLFTISDNHFINNNEAINTGAKATIERNSMTSNKVAITLCSTARATIKNNTFTNNTQTIRIQDNPASAAINYNNFEETPQNSIILVDTTSSIDATNNWWGTTDTQTINITIHDYKYEFGLGKVTFTPFLSEPNQEATPNPEIPEFPSWLVLPMFLLATLVVLVYRKNIGKKEDV